MSVSVRNKQLIISESEDPNERGVGLDLVVDLPVPVFSLSTGEAVACDEGN